MNRTEVIYHDEFMIALNKRPGIPVQPDRSGDNSLLDIAREATNRTPYLVHRIDRPVSGVVLFASTAKSAARLSALFRDQKVRKTYWAIVDSAPPAESGTLEHEILFDHGTNRSSTRAAGHEEPTQQSSHTASGRPARLDYRVIGHSDRYWFLELVPATGRHHQIRAQLAAIGCHIKGDVKYGAKRTNPGGGIHLHARSLSFAHPASGDPVSLTAAPPQDALWQLFEQSVGDAD